MTNTHKKHVARNFLTGFTLSLVILSCGGGGGGGGDDPVAIQPKPLTFAVTGLPAVVDSYELVSLQVTSSINGCQFFIDSNDVYWLESSDGLNFTFRAPIIYAQNQVFNFDISASYNETQTECSGVKNLTLSVQRNATEFVVDPEPSNILDLATPYFQVHDIGMGGIALTDRYTATVCYPTANDCRTETDQLFGQDAHNMATGDFNGDGYEDFVVAWAIFPHTIDQSKKIEGPVNIYLNNKKGSFAEDKTIYANSQPPTHPFAYRVVVEDFNGDGLDDVFAGSMGLAVNSNGYQSGIDPYPHFLLLSNSLGQFEESSSNISDENNGDGLLCRFAHDASGGDPDGDGDIDLYACNILLVNDGTGNFTIHPYLGLDWYHEYMSPMSSLLADLNNDGFDDVLFWNFNDRRIDQVPEEGFVLLSDGTKDIQNWKKTALPVGPFGINQTKYNHAAAGDLNNDGYLDVVVAVTRANPYYEGAYLQVLINDGSGDLFDETSSRFVNQQRIESHHGEGNVYLRDMNLDGALDMIHSTRDFGSNFHGAHIAINDGAGIFSSLNQSVLPDRPDRGWNFTDSLFKGLPIDADLTGCLDLISTVDSWADQSTQTNYLFSILNIDCNY